MLATSATGSDGAHGVAVPNASAAPNASTVPNANAAPNASTATNAGAAALQGIGTPLKGSHGCLPLGNGYLRAKIRGSLTLDVDLHDAELECDGSDRPDHSGVRVSFAGPVRSDGRRLRMVFGIAGTGEGTASRDRPTNLTIIFEGEERIFATRGPDKCTTERLQQERIGALSGGTRAYRIVASGFCISPINALNNNTDTLFVNSFDFAGTVTFEDAPPRS
jgi:hypothetical protein